MPVYEYECAGCDKIFEVQQKIADEPIRVCSQCGGEVRKLISMSSFQLKGSGWYTDGYCSSSNDKGETASAPAKDTPAAPPCQGGAGSCSQCPAAS